MNKKQVSRRDTCFFLRLFHMLGANELPLRQGFRLRRKRLYGACRAAPSCDGVPVADGSQKAEAFLVTHALPDHRVGAPKTQGVLGTLWPSHARGK